MTSAVATSELSAVVIDDDVWALRLMKGMLKECFPMLSVEARTEPDVRGDFQIFFVDNDFRGTRMACTLARQIRATKPDALVIAFSANLEPQTLKELLNSGCNGVCDKSIPSDLPQTMSIAKAYIENFLSRPRPADQGSGVIGTLCAIRGLLREWNDRLSREEEKQR